MTICRQNCYAGYNRRQKNSSKFLGGIDMDEQDFHILLRAKRQIKRETALRSFLFAGLLVAAGLRLFGIDVSFLYPVLFVLLFVSLVMNSDVIANVGLVTKKDLVKLIERQIHNDPDILARYVSTRGKP